MRATDVWIKSPHGELAAWWWAPDRLGVGATVVMAHGFSAVKEHDLDRYAGVFNDAGLGVVVFDNPGFGASGGEPRQEVDHVRQLDAYRAALDWVCGQPGVDDSRLGAWGSSFSGGHAITLAATEPRVACAVAQAPYCEPPAREVPDALRELLAADPGALLPIVAEGDVGNAVLASPGAFTYMASRPNATRWRNEVTLRSIAQFFDYAPIDHAGDIRVPLLAVCAVDDVLTPIEAVRRVLAKTQGETSLVEVPGGHFDVYDAEFPRTSAAARDWFVAHLMR